MRITFFIINTLFSVQAFAYTPPSGIPHPGSWFESDGLLYPSITSGTPGKLAIYSGSNKPEIRGDLHVSCSYCVVENIKVQGKVILTGDHIIFRNSEVYKYKPDRNSSAVYADGTYIVIYRNHIHNNGDLTAIENDVHGISAGNGTSHLWILENNLHHNSGDAVQIGHGHFPDATDAIFIGKNTCHADKENCVDLKIVSNTVISENLMSGYKVSASSEGAAIVLHYCHQNTRILANVISNSKIGISIASLLPVCAKRPVETYITDNTFEGIESKAIQQWDKDNMVVIEGNTFMNSPVGVDLTDCAKGSKVVNNVFSKVKKAISLSGPTCRPDETGNTGNALK